MNCGTQTKILEKNLLLSEVHHRRQLSTGLQQKDIQEEYIPSIWRFPCRHETISYSPTNPVCVECSFSITRISNKDVKSKHFQLKQNQGLRQEISTSNRVLYLFLPKIY